MLLNKIMLPALLVAGCLFQTVCFGIGDNADNSENSNLNHSLKKVIKNYMATTGQAEHISGISLSVKLPDENESRENFTGRVSLDPDAEKIDADSLYQIGSITKSMTAAIILQLEAEDKLNIHQTVGQWLPQYPAWKNVTIEQLLNMTSGIPSYTENLKFQEKAYLHMETQFTKPQLLDYEYPQYSPKLAYDYSNSNYILAELIAEKASGENFADLVKNRILKPEFHLDHTYYAETPYPDSVLKNIVKGYYYADQKSGFLDASKDNLSWASGAGAAISTPEDVVKWIQILYSTRLFPEKQLNELETLISRNTANSGQPISETTPENPLGYALGVAQAYDSKLGGKFWNYEGSSMAYRVYYIYQPCNHIYLTVALNSKSTADDKDSIDILGENIYQAIVKNHPQYQCPIKNHALNN